MSLKDIGKLAKLKIKADNEVFEVMFNPESYSEKFSAKYKKRGSINSGVEEFDYINSIPQEFKLKILIDTTGVTDFHVPHLPVFKKLEKSVYTQVNEFLRLTWYPKEGKPNALEIKWGEFSFHCRLKNVYIKYTLFNREGLPLRAELDATFIGYSEKNKKEYKKRFKKSLKSISSPSASQSSQGGGGATGSQKAGAPKNGIVISVS